MASVRRVVEVTGRASLEARLEASLALFEAELVLEQLGDDSATNARAGIQSSLGLIRIVSARDGVAASRVLENAMTQPWRR